MLVRHTPGHREHAWVAFVLGPLIAILVYSGTSTFDFVYDDVPYVRDNALIQAPDTLFDLWVTPYPSRPLARGLFRPVTALSYVADQRTSGPSPHGYHTTNIALHALACLLFVTLLWTLGAGTVAAAAGGALFAVQPVHAEAVSWIVGRAELLAATFSFTSLIAWIHFRRSRHGSWLWVAAASYFFALSSKETAAPLPALMILGDHLGVFGRHEPSASATPCGTTRSSVWRGVAALGAGLGLYVALRVNALSGLGSNVNGADFFDHSASTRVLTAFAVIGKYFELCAFPHDLRLFYTDFKFSRVSDARVLFGFLVFAASLAIGFALRRRDPRASFWIAWFALFIYPFSNLVFSMGGPLAERFVYIASASAAGLVAVCVDSFDRARGSLSRRWVLPVLLCPWLLFLAFQARSRASDWASNETLFRKEVTLSPLNLDAKVNLAGALMARPGDSAAAADDAIRGLLAQAAPLVRESDSKATTSYFLLSFNYARQLYGAGHRGEAIAQFKIATAFLRAHPGVLEGLSPPVIAFVASSLTQAGLREEAAFFRPLAPPMPDVRAR